MTKNQAEPVAWGVFHEDGSAHIYQQKETADVFGKARPLCFQVDQKPVAWISEYGLQELTTDNERLGSLEWEVKRNHERGNDIPLYLQPLTEAEVRLKVVEELRSSAFLHCDVNKEDVLLCIKHGCTLVEARAIEATKKD